MVMAQTVTALAVYLVGMVVLGYWIYRTFPEGEVEEFLLAKRSLSWLVSGLSAVASATSGWGLLGIAGMAYVTGLPFLWYAIVANWYAYILFYVIGRRLRLLSGKYGSLTLTEFFVARYEDSGTLRAVFSLISTLFMIAYVASQIQAGGKAFLGFLGANYILGAVLTLGITVIYSFLGGYRGVCYTDAIQGLLMICAVILLPVAALVKNGGLSGVLGTIAAEDPSLLTVTGGRTGFALFTFLVGWIGSGLMGFGNPHVTMRVMSIKDHKALRPAGVFASAYPAVITFCGTWVGLCARAILGPGLADRELAFPALASSVFPPWVVGVLMGGVIAAIMSTLDSELLVAIGELSRNIIPTIFRSKRTVDPRAITIVVGLVSLVIAFFLKGFVFWSVLFAWAGLGCTFGPVLLFSLFWKRTTRPAAIVGALSGAITVAVWALTPSLKALVYEGVPGFIVAILSIVIVSLVSKPPVRAEEDFRSL